MSQILVGLHKVGVVGLRSALQALDASPLGEREAILDDLVERLRQDNYVPDAQLAAFRLALWRELLRHRGEDFSDFYSEVELTIAGDPGERRDRFEALVRSVCADFELRPVLSHAPPRDCGEQPVLLAGEREIARGQLHRERLKAAVRASFSDW